MLSALRYVSVQKEGGISGLRSVLFNLFCVFDLVVQGSCENGLDCRAESNKTSLPYLTKIYITSLFDLVQSSND